MGSREIVFAPRQAGVIRNDLARARKFWMDVRTVQSGPEQIRSGQASWALIQIEQAELRTIWCYWFGLWQLKMSGHDQRPSGVVNFCSGEAASVRSSLTWLNQIVASGRTRARAAF